MKVGIHPERYKEVSDFIRKYQIILLHNNIDCEYLHIDDPDFFMKVKKLDAFIYRWFHYDFDRQLATAILPIIRDFLKIPTFPNSVTDWHFDDKIRQYYLLKLFDFPICESWIFWDKKDALAWVEKADFPVIFKLKGGAGSQNVLLVRNRRKAKMLISRMFGRGIKNFGLMDARSTLQNDFRMMKNIRTWLWKIKKNLQGQPAETVYHNNKNYVLFQEFLPGNNYDTRVTIIGDRAFAFRRFNRKNDFRSSGSGLLDYNPEAIDMQFVKLAFEVSDMMKFQSMAYDFLYDENKRIKFCEISYSYMDKAVFDCKGYWDRNLEWHEGHFWPQYCQLQDLLGRPDLIQPEIK